MNKVALRKLYNQKRQALSEAEYLQLSRLLCEQFFVHVDVSFIKVIHIFLPIREKKEPDTWLILDRLRREFPHIRLSLPKINEAGAMEHLYFEGLHQLGKSTWGIEEPRQGVPTPVEKIDLILAPLLCCDSSGNRIGYGKGYYDKLFKQCNSACKKIGISFFEPVDQIEDVEAHDIKLDALLLPSGLRTF